MSHVLFLKGVFFSTFLVVWWRFSCLFTWFWPNNFSIPEVFLQQTFFDYFLSEQTIAVSVFHCHSCDRCMSLLVGLLSSWILKTLVLCVCVFVFSFWFYQKANMLFFVVDLWFFFIFVFVQLQWASNLENLFFRGVESQCLFHCTWAEQDMFHFKTENSVCCFLPNASVSCIFTVLRTIVKYQ